MSPSQSRTTRSFSPDGASGRSGAMLLVAGEGFLTSFAIARERIVIGRAPDCDVAIDDAALSRRHAVLMPGATMTLQDLGSKNGTYLAGRRLEPKAAAPLSFGETFRIGRLSFVLVRGASPREASAQAGAALTVTDPTVESAGAFVADMARSHLNLLILGETGVGKEVLAETLHRLSGRSGELVRVNCAALAPALIESELFGHEKGAFTGAAQARPGLLQAAEGGTVFLDEIGELAPAVQAKLLRAIELGEVRRVGGVRPVVLDVRFIAATNRDLSAEVAAGQFRSDLYFRLDGVTLHIPPLRERRDQIPRLALHFLEAARNRAGAGGLPQLSTDVIDRLRAYDWPGNVRELKAVLERAVLLARGGEIGVRHLAFTPPSTERAAPPATATPAAEPIEPSWTPTESQERERIVAALAECHGNQTRAARLLGVSRATLVNKLSIYRIPRPRK